MKKLVRQSLLIAVFLIAAPHAAQAAPGDLDPAFGTGGKASVSLDPGGETVLRDLIRLPDGKLMAAGGAGPGGSAIFTRFNADGRPDASFGTGGVRKVPGSLWAKLEIQPGKGLIAFGRVGNEPAVARFDFDGNIDPTFGTNGIKVLPVRPFFSEHEGLPKTVETDGPGLDSAGRIIAATSSGGCTQSRQDDNGENRTFGHEWCGDIAIARLTADGELDAGFGGGDGIHIVAAGASQAKTVLAANDDILVAGSTYEEYEDYEWVNRRWVRRLTPEALPRTDFGDNSWVVLSDGERPVKPGLIHSTDQGTVTVSFGLTVFRLDPDGKLDSSFGEDGEADASRLEETSLVETTLTAGRVTDEYIYLAGGSNLQSRSGGGRGAVAVRLNSDGEPDPTFAADGAATTRIGARLPDSSTSQRNELNRGAMLVDGQGRVTVAATGGRIDARRFSLARFQGGASKRLRCQGRPATVQGTDGDDRLFGTRGSVIVAGAGDDVIEGAAGLICAGRGNDHISDKRSFWHGVDAIFAGPGNDRVEIVTYADFVYGEGGNDRIVGPISKAEGGPGNDVLDGGKPSENGTAGNTFLGGPGNDRLIGRNGHDQLFGGPGRDLMRGGPGDDLLEGGPGRDRLEGGRGSDVLLGGPGRDRLDAGPAGAAFTWYKASGPKAKGVLGLLRNRFPRGSLDLQMICSTPDRGRYRSGITLHLRNVRIAKGRFSRSFNQRDGDGFRSSGKFGGKVTPRSIAMSWNLSMSWPLTAGIQRCETGRQKLKLRRLAGRGQVVRQ